jgi:ketosteroid isomerase-like protein
MSPENVELVRSVYDGWVQGDVTKALTCLDPSIVWEAIADAPDAGTYRGHAGVQRYMEDWLRDFDIVSMDVEELMAGEDRLVAAQRARAKGKQSGVDTELHYAVAYRFRGEKIVEIQEFRTKEEALEAMGLAGRGADVIEAHRAASADGDG